jgi:dipeptidase E
MKLYLSSIRIPVPEELSQLVGRPLAGMSVVLITNAKDYYAQRPKDFTVNELLKYMQELGLKVDVIDLRDYNDTEALRSKLASYDLIWAMGGNTFMLRYEMKRSGFDQVIRELLNEGVVYGGDSAGALVAGSSISGIESADEPAFAEEIIKDGMNLVPFVVMPHIDNPEFADVMSIVKKLHKNMIGLKDSQAVVFDSDKHWIVEAKE